MELREWLGRWVGARLAGVGWSGWEYFSVRACSVRLCACVRASVHARICASVCASVWVYVCLCLCVCVCVHVCTCVRPHVVVCVVRGPLPMCMACRRPPSAAIDRYAEIRHAPSGYHPLCSRPSVLLVRSCIAPVAVQSKGKHRIA